MSNPHIQFFSSFLFIILLICASVPVQGQEEIQTQWKRGEKFNSLFSEIFESLSNSNAIKNYVSSEDNDVIPGTNQGLALVSLMKLYDLYNYSYFIDLAKQVSDFIATNLVDLRFDLAATYFDPQEEIISNYRAVVDNLLAAWGLEMLADRIDPNDELEVKRQRDRADFIQEEIDKFVTSDQFVEDFRIDIDDIQDPRNFKSYHNLMSSFIISETRIDVFSDFSDKIEDIYSFVEQNLLNENGGVFSLYFNGFRDEIITLRNTVLFANLGINLYEETNNPNYLDQANKSLNYIQQEFYDIGITGGYLEAIRNGNPIQQSKSLYSHALMLLALLKMSNLGDNQARINLIALWKTITSYFKLKDSALFLSTIKRNGEPASASISVLDNLMMIYSMTQLPLLLNISYPIEIEFRNKIGMDILTQIPTGLTSELILTFDDEEVYRTELIGEDNFQLVELDLTVPRPRNSEQDVFFSLALRTKGIDTDTALGTFTVISNPGVDLSIEVISIFSILGIIVFVLFFNRLNRQITQVSSTD